MEVKAGVIGTGLIGPVHIGALRRLPYVTVKALASNGIDKAQYHAQKLGIPDCYGDYREMLEDADIDTVHVCSPNYLHFQMVKEALLADKHVICEKPLALTSGEARTLTELARERNLVNAVHFNIRFYPLMAELRSMVAAGELGNIFSVHGSYLQDWLFFDHDYNWRIEPGLSGPSRAVADIGSHWMDLVEYVLGMQISEVCADFCTFHKVRKKPTHTAATYANMMQQEAAYTEVPVTTEDFANIMFRFSGGGRGMMTVSQVAAGRKNRLSFEMNGSKQSVCWDSQIPNQMWIGFRERANQLMIKDPSLFHPEAVSAASLPGGHNEGFHDTSHALLHCVYKDILQGHPSRSPEYPTFVDGLREMVLTEKIIESSTKGTWISIDG